MANTIHLNEIVYKWYSKCCSLNISPYGEMIQEEALKVKERLSEEGQIFKILPRQMDGSNLLRIPMAYVKRELLGKEMMCRL